MRPLGTMHTKRVCRNCGESHDGSDSLCPFCEIEMYDDRGDGE